jgi:hypothetical protein
MEKKILGKPIYVNLVCRNAHKPFGPVLPSPTIPEADGE